MILRSCPLAAALLSGAVCLTGCDSPHLGLDPPDPVGPAPVVSVDLAFGKAPVRGFLRIVPPSGSTSWQWRIDELGGDPGGLKGVVNLPVAVPYEYEDPGAHQILVELTGPEGTVVVEEWVVVDDPTGHVVLASRPIVEIFGNGTSSAEGIAIDPDGSGLYVTDYWGGEIARLDAQTLATLKTVDVTPSAEGARGISRSPGTAVVPQYWSFQDSLTRTLEELTSRRRFGSTPCPLWACSSTSSSISSSTRIRSHGIPMAASVCAG